MGERMFHGGTLSRRLFDWSPLVILKCERNEGDDVDHTEPRMDTRVTPDVKLGDCFDGDSSNCRFDRILRPGDGHYRPVVIRVGMEIEERFAASRFYVGQEAIVAALTDVDSCLQKLHRDDAVPGNFPGSGSRMRAKHAGLAHSVTSSVDALSAKMREPWSAVGGESFGALAQSSPPTRRDRFGWPGHTLGMSARPSTQHRCAARLGLRFRRSGRTRLAGRLDTCRWPSNRYPWLLPRLNAQCSPMAFAPSHHCLSTGTGFRYRCGSVRN